MKSLQESFTFGQWAEDAVVFCGRRYKQVENGISVDQQEYADTADFIRTPTVRARETDAPLTPAEETNFRSVAGVLLWLTLHTRPDLASALSLSQDSNKRIINLVNVEKALAYARKTSLQTIMIRKIDMSDACIIAYGDSSWANAAGFKSQAGLVIGLAEKGALTADGGTWSLLAWRSYRIKRVCRSTLAAETSACDVALDLAEYIRKIMVEMLNVNCRATDRRSEKYDPATTMVPTYIVTDCRSLYDLLTKMSAPGAGITEKRVAIDIFAIREILPKERVRWVPTYRMLADGMTKVMTPMKIWAVVTAERVALQGRVSFEDERK